MTVSRRKKKKNKKIYLFLLTFLLTISAGSVVLLGGWAFFGTDGAGTMAGNAQRQQGDVIQAAAAPAAPGEKSGTGQAGADQNSGTGQAGADQSGGTDSTAGEKEGMAADSKSQSGPTHVETQKQEQDAAQKSAQGKYSALLEDTQLCLEQNIYARDTARPDEITIAFAGDILFDDHYAIMARMKGHGKGIQGSISQEMLDVMHGADIFMLNNEFPYSDRGEPTPDKKYTFHARTEYVSYLFDMGVDIVSLANNHASDYGPVSLTDTLEVLKNVGMPYVGAGQNLAEASKPVCFVANDKRIALISATQIERMPNPATPGATENSPGVFRCLDIDRLLEAVREAKQDNDYVIVYIHWGTESTDEIDWAQTEQAPLIAEAGADLIIGDHPHVLQPIGFCEDTPVIYSLGNFLFNSKAQDTCIVQVKLDANGLKSLQFIPARQEDCRVTMHHGAEKERVLSYMRSISPQVNIDADGFVTKK